MRNIFALLFAYGQFWIPLAHSELTLNSSVFDAMIVSFSASKFAVSYI